MTPQVTLLIPNYNGARFLRETITRLLAQTYRDFTLIVCDNVSTDASAEIVESFSDPRLRLVRATEHVCITANFNRAADLVETPFYATCASDEVYEPQWLEAMLELHATEPGAFFACCKADSADEDGRVYTANAERYKASFWPPQEPCVFDRDRYLAVLMKASFFICTTGVYRTEAARQIGRIDERHNFAGDWQYWVRGLLAGYKIVGTHRSLVHYRRHSDMTSHAFNTNLFRFRDELEVTEWIAKAGFEQGVFDTPEPEYGLVMRSLLSELATRLAVGNDAGARQLHDFARREVPGFKRSAFDALATVAVQGGRRAGAALKTCESIFLHANYALRRRLPSG